MVLPEAASTIVTLLSVPLVTIILAVWSRHTLICIALEPPKLELFLPADALFELEFHSIYSRPGRRHNLSSLSCPVTIMLA